MKRGIIMIIICALSFWTLPVQATLITIEIEGVVDIVMDAGNHLEGKIKPGDIISGAYTYDLSTADTNPSPYVGDYYNYASPCGISLTVGGFEFKTDPANVYFGVQIVNDYTSGELHDSYILTSYRNLPLSNGSSVERILWWLGDTSATALSNDALPTTAPVLGDWQGNLLRLYGERDSMYNVDAHVTYIIPEPATILLLGLGLLLLRKRT